MIPTIIQATVFIVYVYFIYSQFGILPSISDSWYKLKPLKLGFLFTLFCWGVGIPMLFHTSDISPFFFFSGSGLCFVGVATAFKLKIGIERYVHGAGAIICVISGLIALWTDYKLWFPSLLFIIGTIIILLIKTKNKIWWFEIAAFLSILSGLIYHYFSYLAI